MLKKIGGFVKGLLICVAVIIIVLALEAVIDYVIANVNYYLWYYTQYLPR